ncbi:hypothetical protein BWR59_08375 [Pseudomonas sp. Bc-h]|jgi:hypothetical protein|uniref:hypothetical protein n=1 Tax=Pseudomonas sp. Bc-h TaxID=1943632 RepID=UPI0009DAC697|nr:hypothetical protein [Pseudomonas sp. Bc-h]OQR34051.1 hypothetical protein BWR59_08375 [Pseudomonas sp. Bc-h]
MTAQIESEKEISHSIYNLLLHNTSKPCKTVLLACVETVRETSAMRSRHILKYLILFLVFGTCMAYAHAI